MSRVDDHVIIDDIHWFFTYECRIIHTWWFIRDILRPMSFIPVYVIIDSVIFTDWIFIDEIHCLNHCQWSHLGIHDIDWGMSRVNERTFIRDQSVNIINEYHVVNDDIFEEMTVNEECHVWMSQHSYVINDVERRMSRVNEPTFICDQSKNILNEYSINEYHVSIITYTGMNDTKWRMS